MTFGKFILGTTLLLVVTRYTLEYTLLLSLEHTPRIPQGIPLVNTTASPGILPRFFFEEHGMLKNQLLSISYQKKVQILSKLRSRGRSQVKLTWHSTRVHPNHHLILIQKLFLKQTQNFTKLLSSNMLQMSYK